MYLDTSIQKINVSAGKSFKTLGKCHRQINHRLRAIMGSIFIVLFLRYSHAKGKDSGNTRRKNLHLCPTPYITVRVNNHLVLYHLADSCAIVVGNQKCTACARGTFAGNKGMLQCEICPIGRVQPRKGRSSCDPCTFGHYQNQAGNQFAFRMDFSPG